MTTQCIVHNTTLKSSEHIEQRREDCSGGKQDRSGPFQESRYLQQEQNSMYTYNRGMAHCPQIGLIVQYVSPHT